MTKFKNNEYDFDHPDTRKKISRLLAKPNIYLDAKEKWTLLGYLFQIFGANFDSKNQENNFHWGIEDSEHFKFLQDLINAITGSSCKGFYSDFNGTWKMKF